jgi:hypothetical protein
VSEKTTTKEKETETTTTREHRAGYVVPVLSAGLISLLCIVVKHLLIARRPLGALVSVLHRACVPFNEMEMKDGSC